MSKANSRTYCLCLYCDYDNKTEDLIAVFADEEKRQKIFLDERDDIDDIMKSLGDGAEWQGSNGGVTTTWNVKEQSMIPLMQKIQDYNSIEGQLHIIHIQLY